MRNQEIRMSNTGNVNMSETASLMRNGHKPKTIYSGVLAAPIQDSNSRSLAASEYLVRKSKEGFNVPGIPLFRAIFVVMNGAMGAGILNFPHGFARAGGVFSGMMIQLCMLVFIVGSFLILAYCADKCGAQNFQQIIRGSLGPKHYITAEIIVLVYMVGTAVAYMVLIADQLDKVGSALDPANHWYSSRNFLQTVVALFLLLPLCLPKHLGVLSYTSTLGGVGVMYICFVAAYKYFQGTYNAKIKLHVERDFSQYLTVIPTICFGYQCHVQSVSVYAELKRPTIPRFAVVCILAMLFCCIAYSFTACFGYLTFGQKLEGDFLRNYDNNDVLANVARVVLALVVLSSYAACFFCGRSSVEGLWMMCFRMSIGQAQRNAQIRRIIITVTWVTFALLCSIFIPDVNNVIALVGGIAALFILFYPGLCLVVELIKEPHLTLTHWLLIILGMWYVFMGVFVLTESEVLAVQPFFMKKNKA